MHDHVPLGTGFRNAYSACAADALVQTKSAFDLSLRTANSVGERSVTRRKRFVRVEANAVCAGNWRIDGAVATKATALTEYGSCNDAVAAVFATAVATVALRHLTSPSADGGRSMAVWATHPASRCIRSCAPASKSRRKSVGAGASLINILSLNERAEMASGAQAKRRCVDVAPAAPIGCDRLLLTVYGFVGENRKSIQRDRPYVDVGIGNVLEHHSPGVHSVLSFKVHGAFSRSPVTAPEIPQPMRNGLLTRATCAQRLQAIEPSIDHPLCQGDAVAQSQLYRRERVVRVAAEGVPHLIWRTDNAVASEPASSARASGHNDVKTSVELAELMRLDSIGQGDAPSWSPILPPVQMSHGPVLQERRPRPLTVSFCLWAISSRASVRVRRACSESHPAVQATSASFAVTLACCAAAYGFACRVSPRRNAMRPCRLISSTLKDMPHAGNTRAVGPVAAAPKEFGS
ncbi:hypothetical protein DES41_102161 [Pseudorhodoferax soli]|uniref:Uncharacterized protein n=1 Tax=Pseudorhodoferax soli TaxID=545864 RepID=A0A368Y4T4_9BURK|nr:hypothetical protein DES41_102161 [Pseudorhodoferax soli]